jgi:hypothetical protein
VNWYCDEVVTDTDTGSPFAAPANDRLSPRYTAAHIRKPFFFICFAFPAAVSLLSAVL